MVFEGQNAGYEVIQALPEAGGNLHYRCRRDGGEEICHLAAVPLGEDILSRVAVWQENPAFADLMDYFIWEDRICLVFPAPSGSVLLEALESLTPEQRFSVGQQVMEQFLIQDMPLCLRWELACPEAIYVGEDGIKISFFYLLKPVSEYVKATEESSLSSLYGLFEALFSEKIQAKYPETGVFLGQRQKKETTDLMAVYTEYLELLPALSRSAEAENREQKPPGERLKKLWKKWSKILLSALKVSLGVTTLCAALILLPQVWEEKISPVIDGALLWKRVYVDGESLPGSEETDPPEETGEEDGGAGRRTLYWENGQVRYQGGMQDDLYEGTGTLFYADGTVEYQGSFSFGKKEGEGISFMETGQMLYEGQFHNDRYEGEGRLYDKEYGSLLYEGGFRSGKYSGEGTLYHPLSDFPLYVGGFRLGHYDGKGLQYDENGCMLYEGDFLLGVYHGNGTIYDPETGVVLFAGAFRNGMPVLTEELLVEPGEETEADALPSGATGEGTPKEGTPEDAVEPAGGQGEAESAEEAGDGDMPAGKTDGAKADSKTPTDDKSPVIGPVGGDSSSEGGPGI